MRRANKVSQIQVTGGVSELEQKLIGEASERLGHEVNQTSVLDFVASMGGVNTKNFGTVLDLYLEEIHGISAPAEMVVATATKPDVVAQPAERIKFKAAKPRKGQDLAVLEREVITNVIQQEQQLRKVFQKGDALALFLALQREGLDTSGSFSDQFARWDEHNAVTEQNQAELVSETQKMIEAAMQDLWSVTV
jgi:hypothetical protein